MKTKKTVTKKIKQGDIIEIHNEKEREYFLNSLGILTDKQIQIRQFMIVIMILLFSLFALGTFFCYPEAYMEVFKNTL